MDAIIIGKYDDKVKVDTQIGCFEGVWCSTEPAEFKRYILELDSDEILTSEAIAYSDINIPYIKNIEGNVCLNGFVEDVQNRVMFLRLSKSLIMLELCEDTDFSGLQNYFVKITLKKINLFDAGVY